MLGTHPCRTDTVPADMSWVLPLPGPRFFPWNTPDRWAARPSCVPPDMSPCHPRGSATCFRRNHRPECVRHGVWASLVFALPFPPRRPARLPALLPPVLSPLGLGAKTGTKTGAKIGAHTPAAVPSWIAGQARGKGRQGGGSAATLPRRRLFAKYAFGQRFLANSPSRPGSARPRPGVPPLAPCPPLDAADRGHSPRCAVPALARGRQP